jgi:uncharacterized iron-regulated membrane protein
MYKIHKWVAVSVGLFILIWLLTGIVMILPPLFPGSDHKQESRPLNFREATVSPAEAVNELARVLGSFPEVNWVSLRRVGDTLAYQISLKSGSSYLIDTRSRQLFTVTPEMAEQIARGESSLQTNVHQIELLRRHTFDYSWGPLPAYRISFNDEWGTVSYVSTIDGTVQRSDRRSRIRAAITSLHTFEPLTLVTERDRVRKGALLLLSFIGIGATATGYYLALPRRQASRRGLAAETFLGQGVAGLAYPDLGMDGETVAPPLPRKE